MSGLEPVEQTEEDFGIEITDLDMPNVPGGNLSSWFVGSLLAWQRPENWRRLSLVSIFFFPLIFVLIVLEMAYTFSLLIHCILVLLCFQL